MVTITSAQQFSQPWAAHVLCDRVASGATKSYSAAAKGRKVVGKSNRM